jgi:hypothetical protein
MIDGLYVREGLGTASVADIDGFKLLDNYVTQQLAALKRLPANEN